MTSLLVKPFWRMTLYVSCTFLIACQDKSGNPPVKITRINTLEQRVILSDTMPSPEVLPLGPQVTVETGKPEILPINDNTRHVSFVRTTADTAHVNIPGKGAFLLPKRVQAHPRIVQAGAPQVVMAKPFTSKDYNPFNLANYDQTQGLVDTEIQDIYSDRMGNVWFGTANGISKFNGKTFENYTSHQGLIGDKVQCMLQDQAGNMWFAFREGVTMYDGEKFFNYTRASGLCTEYIVAIFEDSEGNMWFGSRGKGTCKLDKNRQTFTHYSREQGLASTVLSITGDKNGNIWFGSCGNGLFRFDGESFTQYNNIGHLPDKSIRKLMMARTGSLWIATSPGLVRFDGHAFTIYKDITEKMITGIQEDTDGNIWLSTWDAGAFSLNPKDQSVSQLTTREGLLNNELTSMVIDPGGNLWLGSVRGIVKHSRRFTTLTNHDGLVSNAVRSVIEDSQHRIWIGSEAGGGLACLDLQQKTITRFEGKDKLGDDSAISLMEDKQGNIWIGTKYGHLVRLNADRRSFTHFPESGALITSIMEDEKGNIWFSSEEKGGVFRIDLLRGTKTHFTTKQGLCDNRVSQIYRDKAKNIWFCTAKGVSRLSRDERVFTHFTRAEGLNFDSIVSIEEDQLGHFWLGTNNDGILRLNLKNNTWRHLTESDGLASNSVYGLHEDRKGNLWISTRAGVNKLKKEELDRLANSPETTLFFNTYTSASGNTGFGDGRYYLTEDHKGNLWIPKRDRLTMYHPASHDRNTNEPMVQISNVSLYEQSIAWKKDTSYLLANGVNFHNSIFTRLARWTRVPEGLSLAHDNNFLKFEFVGVHVNSSPMVRYQYRLLGLESNWSAASNNTEARYGNLGAGRYTFQVRAINEDGVKSDDISYNFIIRPPWWETWWMIVIYVMAAVTVIYAFVRYNIAQGIRRAKDMEAIRVKISRDLHDDVGSILGGLAVQSEMMALTANEEEKSRLYELNTMSREAMEGMRDTVWSIDTRKDKYENLIDRMRAFAETNLQRRQITHDFSIDVADVKKNIDPQKRQHLYLIFKEAITNIVKHSDGTHVKVIFKANKHNLMLSVHDNGSPPKPACSTDGLGINNMRMRASQLQGKLTALYDSGFKIELFI